MDWYQAVEPVCDSQHVLEMALIEHDFILDRQIDFQKKKPKLFGYTQEWFAPNGNWVLVRVKNTADEGKPPKWVGCIVGVTNPGKE